MVHVVEDRERDRRGETEKKERREREREGKGHGEILLSYLMIIKIFKWKQHFTIN